jgi:predicted nucleotidyltransferase
VPPALPTELKRHGAGAYDELVTKASVTWEVRGGHALWHGRPLDDWAHDLASELVALFDPIEVWLLGSVARGDDDGDSDIDMLVVLDCYDPHAASSLKLQMSRSTAVRAPFDVAFTDATRMQRRARIAGALERAALNEGRLMYRRG